MIKLFNKPKDMKSKFGYEELIEEIKKKDKINRNDFLKLVDKYGFYVLTKVEHRISRYSGENEVWNTYENIINVVKEKVDFKITNDQDILLLGIRNNVETFDLASKKLKNDKEFILKVLMTSSEHKWILTKCSKSIRKACEGKEPVMVLEKLLNYDKFQKEIEMKEQSQIQVVNMKKNKI